MPAMIQLEKSRLLHAAPRLMQILRVLIKHKFLRALRGKNHWPPPNEVRETFEELGLTFLKLGQVLAMRRDLLSDAYIDELEQLHDQLPAMGIDTVRMTIETELGIALTEVFASFSETPLAAATIAQVHEATLLDGRHVAVKIQRPGLEKIISTDIAALTYLVKVGETLFPHLRALDLPVLIREFANSLNSETDFSREADSIRLVRTAVAEIPNLWIPDVVAGCSGKTMLTLDFCDCERIDFYVKRHPETTSRLINTLVRVMLQTIFENGLFHADPHPGNVRVHIDGKLSILDFGMIGELDEQMRESLTDLLAAVVKGDARQATDAYLGLAMASESVNRAALTLDIKAVLYEIHRSTLSDVSIGDAFALLLRAGCRHRVHNPADFFHLTRAFVIMESMIRQLDPNFDYIGAFHEQISRLTAQRFSLDEVKEKTGRVVLDLERLMIDAPGDTRRILRRLAEGNLGRVHAPVMENLGGRATRYLGRLPVVLNTSAILVTGGLMITAPRDVGMWHHYTGEVMVTAGIISTIIISLKALSRNRGRG
ncbi:ABC1 kinase family protein [Geomonas silvestris]|nr:AarF/UbiB family protein [Geomonas silvestris]